MVASIAAQSVTSFLTSTRTSLTQIYFVDVRPEMVTLFIQALSRERQLRRREYFYGNNNGEVLGLALLGARSPQREPTPADKSWDIDAPIPAPSDSPSPPTAPQPMTFISAYYPPTKIHVLCHDITKLCVDVIVNASNPGLQHRAGVSKAIERAAGKDVMQAECRAFLSTNGQIRTGDHAKTGPGNLSCQMVFHAVGPQYTDPRTYRRELSKTINGCLQEARTIGYASIAFPSIGSGENQHL